MFNHTHRERERDRLSLIVCFVIRFRAYFDVIRFSPHLHTNDAKHKNQIHQHEKNESRIMFHSHIFTFSLSFDIFIVFSSTACGRVPIVCIHKFDANQLAFVSFSCGIFLPIRTSFSTPPFPLTSPTTLCCLATYDCLN